MLVDRGYPEEYFAQGVREPLGENVTVQIIKGNGLHPFKVIPKRWIAKRSFRLGKIANGYSTPAFNMYISPFWLCFLGVPKQNLQTHQNPIEGCLRALLWLSCLHLFSF